MQFVLWNQPKKFARLGERSTKTFDYPCSSLILFEYSFGSLPANINVLISVNVLLCPEVSTFLFL